MVQPHGNLFTVRPQRQTGRLRAGRVSAPGEIYFVTACTAGRAPLFVDSQRAEIAHSVLVSSPAGGDVEWLAGTVMPDHIHALFVLGRRLSLDRLLAKLKGEISRRCRLGGKLWQENVYEHRLRPQEKPESYAFYVYMNPYRAGVCGMANAWPWWLCTDPAQFGFCDQLRPDGSPQPAWLSDAEKIAAGIHHGE